MIPRRNPSGKEQAFTLAEMMVGAAIGSLLLLAMITGAIACQRVSAATDDGLRANADQLRVLDYIVRDVRQALTATITNSGQVLTLTVPDYIDSSTGLPRIPTIIPKMSSSGMPNGTVDYGSAAAPITVSYFTANAPIAPATTYTFETNGSYVIRQQGNVQSIISRDCTSLQLGFIDQTTSIRASISFQPRFNFLNRANSRNSTATYATPSLRNNRRN